MKKQRVMQIICTIAIVLCFAFVGFNQKVKAAGYDPGGEVSYYVKHDGADEFTEMHTTYGTPVIIAAEVIAGKTFLFWVNMGKIISTEASITVPIYGGEHFVSYYKTTGSFVAIYVDANNDFIEMKDNLTVPDFEPQKIGYTFDGWTAPVALTEDVYIRATYTAGQINPELDTTGNAVKMGYLLNGVNLAFIVDVDTESTPVEMGIIYNAAGDPKETAGTILKRAYRYSSNYEFSVSQVLPLDEKIYAYAYAVTNSGGLYTTQYSRLVTIWNCQITYHLDQTEHLIDRNQLVDEFVTDFNTTTGATITSTTMHLASTDAHHNTFWQNVTMYNKWKWLAEHIYSVSTHETARTIWNNIINGLDLGSTQYSYWPSKRDISGFLMGGVCTWYIATAPIDFTIVSHANYFINTFEPTMQLYSGELATPIKVGHTFNGWVDIAEQSVTVPTESITLYPTWTANPYTITYNLNGGSLSTTYNSYTILDNITLDEPTREGYMFGGWYENPGLTGVRIDSIIAHTRYGGITLYAKWNEEGGGSIPGEIGQIAINTYDTSIWSGYQTRIYLDPDSAGGQYFYRIILAKPQSAGIYAVSRIVLYGETYTFNSSEDAYSIHVHPDNAAGYAAVTGLGIQVGDFITFDVDLSTLSPGDQPITAHVIRPGGGE